MLVRRAARKDKGILQQTHTELEANLANPRSWFEISTFKSLG